MRRYISLACVALIVVMCMVSPVSATEFSNKRLNVLDFCNVSKTNLSTSSDIVFNYDFSVIYDSVDIVARFYIPPTSVSLMLYNGSFHELNISEIGNRYYRIYGNVPTSDLASATLRIISPSANWVEFLSFYLLCNENYFDSDCYCAISALDYDKTIHFVSSDEINYRTWVGTEDIYNMSYQLTLYNLNWRNYDYIDYTLYTYVDSIGSINCTMGGVNVPFEVSFIDNDAAVAMDYIYTIRVDCRDLDRTSSDYPMVEVSGNVITGSANMIAVVSCMGVLDVSLNVELTLIQRIFNSINYVGSIISSSFDTLDLNLYSYFSNTFDWINHQTTVLESAINYVGSIISSSFHTLDLNLHSYFSNTFDWINHQTTVLESAIRGDTAPGDSFQQEVDQKDQQLNDMAAVMDSVERPELDAVNVSADSYIDSTVLATSMSGITSVIGSPVFLDVIMMSLIMATAGYVLFGKR